MKAYGEKSLIVTINEFVVDQRNRARSWTMDGMAVEASIEMVGLPAQNTATVKVWGMSHKDMNDLTERAHPLLKGAAQIGYTLSVLAGTEQFGVIPRNKRGMVYENIPLNILTQVDPLTVAFSGHVVSAHADYSTAPDVHMVFECQTGLFEKQAAKSDKSLEKRQTIQSLYEELLEGSSFRFRNEVGERFVNEASVFEGSILKQAYDLATSQGLKLIVENQEMILTLPENARRGVEVAINKETGMIGYPILTKNGIKVSTLYNPAIQFDGIISVDSVLPTSSSTWRVTKMTHNLAAYKDGKWQTDIEACVYRTTRSW